MPETLESLLSRKAALDTLLDSIERWAIFFAIVVGIGVVGEAVFSFRAWWNNRKLHVVQASIDQFRQAEIARLTAVGDSLKQEMKGSDLRIAEAQRDAAQANVIAKQYEGSIADSNARAKSAEAQVASAKEQAAKAELGAAQARLELARMQERMADRTLTVAQQADLTSRLNPFSAIVVDVLVWGDTPEIQIISGLILDCMTKGGWKVQRANAIRRQRGGSRDIGWHADWGRCYSDTSFRCSDFRLAVGRFSR